METKIELKIPRPSLLTWLDKNMAQFKALAIDIDGVLFIQDHPLPGSRRLLQILRETDTPFCLITNDAYHSAEEKTAKLQACGLDIKPTDILSAGHVLQTVFPELGLTGQPVTVLGKVGDPCYVAEAGAKPYYNLDRVTETRGFIIGEGDFDWQSTFNAMINRLIAEPHLPVIVPNPDHFFPRKNGRVHIGPGTIAAWIESMLAENHVIKKTILLGKPHKAIYQRGLKKLQKQTVQPLTAGDVLMVGDSLIGDIAGAQNSGYRTALILTGLTQEHSLLKSKIRPDWVFKKL